ncbi:MAG: hypothetical protein PHQ47_02415 [Candidatus Portnoybacteria bacterium]|nr:hypothetical protein [Candidatus Portnoybacteria bacterium]
MKRRLVFVVMVLFFAANAPVALAENSKFYGRINFGFYSNYIGGLTGSRAFNHPVFQQSLALGLKNPYVDVEGEVWSSVSPRGGFNSDSGDEIDYSINFSREFAGFRLGLGYNFFDLYRLGRINGDLHAICFNVVSPPVFKYLSFYLILEEDIPTDKEFLDGGFLGKIGAVWSQPIFANCTLNLDGSFGGHDGAYGLRSEPLSYGRLKTSFVISLWKIWKNNLYLIPEVSFQKDLGHDDGLACDRIWGGVKLSVAF